MPQKQSELVLLFRWPTDRRNQATASGEGWGDWATEDVVSWLNGGHSVWAPRKTAEMKTFDRLQVIFTSSHPLIFTPTHVIFTSSHLLFTSSHFHVFTSAHRIFTSAHVHICSLGQLFLFCFGRPFEPAPVFLMFGAALGPALFVLFGAAFWASSFCFLFGAALWASSFCFVWGLRRKRTNKTKKQHKQKRNEYKALFLGCFFLVFFLIICWSPIKWSNQKDS